MKVLLLRFDAPLVSFGAPMVDQNGVVQRFPTLSLLTGLIANALGWEHADAEKLASLQERIRYAARIDRQGEALVDYQTVDLGKDWMIGEKAGWTTRGKILDRGGASGAGTHQRYRHYRADSVHIVALMLTGQQEPSLEKVQAAMSEPARPLFIGRKCCIPATRILVGVVQAPSLLAALLEAPRDERGDSGLLPATWWESDEPVDTRTPSRLVAVTDERDWRNQIHVGRRLMREGLIDPPPHA